MDVGFMLENAGSWREMNFCFFGCVFVCGDGQGKLAVIPFLINVFYRVLSILEFHHSS
jgi:hypothetical protein